MKRILVLFIIAIMGGWPVFGFAEISKGTSLSSDNFKILDSQHSLFGGTASSSSSNFILSATIGDFAIGSSSITNFGLRSGFLYFPKVTAAVLDTATAGDAQVALAWTAATAFQGWTIGGYNVCHKSTGSYTCVDVGNVTSSTKTGLTNGTTYTFKIEAYDGLATKNIIAESNEKTAAPASAATPTPTPTPAPSGGGGGGGGGGSGQTTTTQTGTVVARGIAYPKSTINIYVDSTLWKTAKAGNDAKFNVILDNVPAGSRVIGLNSTDSNGRKSVTISFTVPVQYQGTVYLEDILLTPTIDLSVFNVAKGDSLRIFGQSAPVSEVNIHIASEEVILKTTTDSNGSYAVLFDTDPLEEGEHTAKSRTFFEQLLSPFSSVLRFFVGEVGQLKTADLNKDGRVNIIDFSILLYWWNTNNTRGLDVADINIDNRVNIIDFSIMLFQWTG
ncbi:MAG: hypothetical protein HY505_00325 [Candidatus Yanofskybacteria bacterium]|nr:hypothetical protein [Candidatus Yanofskybacteria bacterium]